MLYVILSKSKSADSMYTEVYDFEKKSEQLISVRTALREAMPLVNGVERALVSEDYVSVFIDNLETLANDSDLRLSIGSLSIDQIPNVSSLKRMIVRLSVDGLWSDVVAFSSFLESMQYATSIESISFSRNPRAEGSDARVWNAMIDLVVFVAP